MGAFSRPEHWAERLLLVPDDNDSSREEDGDDEDEGKWAIVVVGRQFEVHRSACVRCAGYRRHKSECECSLAIAPKYRMQVV